MPQEDYTPLLIGAGALLILAKWGLGNIPNPLPKIGAAAVKTADELTGGLQKDRDESLPEFLFGGKMADVPWGAPIDIAEPDQSTGSFLFEIDLPGVPAYDLRSAPGDIYRGTIGRIL